MTTSQLDVTNESQEVNPFPAGDHKASINRRTRNITKQDRNKVLIGGLVPEAPMWLGPPLLNLRFSLALTVSHQPFFCFHSVVIWLFLNDDAL